VAVLAGIGALMLHLRNNGNLPAGSTTPIKASSSASPTSRSSSAPAPVSVVNAYYDAVNSHDYATAYRLNKAAHTKPYASFKQGFTGTKHVDITITGVSGHLVSFDLTAHQTDGTVKIYTGTYTVRNGKIALANVRRTS
jgi:hypothetical protein